MLSFLKEQSIGEMLGRKPADADKSPEGVSEKPQEQEYITVATKGKNLRKSTMLLVVLFGLGLLCLWFMIKKSSPQKAAAGVGGTEEKQIELAIARLTGVKSEMFTRMDQILKKFYEFSNVFQVDVDELVKNPFELELFLANLKSKLAAEQKDSKIEVGMLIQQQMAEMAKGMQLLSIMHSQQGNCCMIDGKVLYEGDLIRGFKVTQIGANSVTLRWTPENVGGGPQTQLENMEIVLKISE
jgi:preprotein translocase subunit SecG